MSKEMAYDDLRQVHSRCLYQSFGYWVKEPSIQNPQLAVEGVRELARQGYELVRVMLRGTNFTFRSPEYVAVIAWMTEEAHRLGLKIVLDCEPHSQIAGREMGRKFPGGMGRRLYQAAGPLVAGRFKLRIKAPHGAPPLPRLEAAFVRQGGMLTKLAALPFDVDFEQEFCDTGFAERYVDYTPSRAPVTPQHFFHVRGRLPENQEGELAAVVPVEVAYHTAGDQGRLVIWRADKKSNLLTTNKLAPLLVPADTDTVRYAVFRYRLKDRRKWETLTVHQGNTMTYERDGDSVVLEEWLRARGFVMYAFGKGGFGKG